MDQPLAAFLSLLLLSTIIKHFLGQCVPVIMHYNSMVKELKLQDCLWDAIQNCATFHNDTHNTMLLSSSLQHMTRSGVKMTLLNSVISSCHLTVEYKRKNTRHCYRTWSLFIGWIPYVLFGGGGGRVVMWFRYAAEHFLALKLWHAVTSPVCWLLKKTWLCLELLALVHPVTKQQWKILDCHHSGPVQMEGLTI